MSDTRTNLSFYKGKRQNLKDEMGHLPIYWGGAELKSVLR